MISLFRSKLKSAASLFRGKVAARRRERHRRMSKVARYAPYPASVYPQLLSRILRDDRLQVVPFASIEDLPSSKARFFVRHDIDTAACASGMRLLLDIDREMGITPGVYFRADETEYRLSPYRGEVAAYRDAGFEIGLHTVCYVQDDFMSAFGRETRVFADSFGFAPTTFTVHGLGQHRLEIRQRFNDEICRRLDEFGYRFSDCCQSQRIYDHVLHDSHWDEDRSSRFIYDEFTDRSFPFAASRNYLLLTHPCYWT